MKKRDLELSMLEQKLERLPAPQQKERRLSQGYLINARFEVELDKLLHNHSNGPYFLGNQRIAWVVINSWLSFQENMELIIHAICVMSNHVHVILEKPTQQSGLIDIGVLMKRHKGYTARLANQLLDRTGTSFWQPSYFDRTIRPGKFARVMWYVLNNPVQPGLTVRWEGWPNTYLHPMHQESFVSQ